VVPPPGTAPRSARSPCAAAISGGENIASVEAEQVIAEHPAVLEVAVIGVSDDKGGEVPAAHVTLHRDATATEEEISAHVQARLVRFRAPISVTFGELPKTSTGKIRKYLIEAYRPLYGWR
jgi:fatty-acyl-CoA synthase